MTVQKMELMLFCNGENENYINDSELAQNRELRYDYFMKTNAVGMTHKLPDDLKEAIISDTEITKRWEDITPLARNEFICWVENAKQIETRKRRIKRTCEELKEGKRRPCCWVGCVHRSDKEMSPSQKWVLSRQAKSK